MQIDRVCPRGHGELTSNRPYGYFCEHCRYVHFLSVKEPRTASNGDTWEDGTTLHLYDGKRGEWVRVRRAPR